MSQPAAGLPELLVGQPDWQAFLARTLANFQCVTGTIHRTDSSTGLLTLIAMGHKPAGWFSQVLDEAFEAQLDGVFGDEAGGLAWLAERMVKGVV